MRRRFHLQTYSDVWARDGTPSAFKTEEGRLQRSPKPFAAWIRKLSGCDSVSSQSDINSSPRSPGTLPASNCTIRKRFMATSLQLGRAQNAQALQLAESSLRPSFHPVVMFPDLLSGSPFRRHQVRFIDGECRAVGF